MVAYLGLIIGLTIYCSLRLVRRINRRKRRTPPPAADDLGQSQSYYEYEIACLFASRTSGQGNLTNRPHRLHTWTVQSCSPVNVTPMCTYFLGPTRIHNPNGISIGSAAFAQRTAESV